jgi:hypothetical protein
MSDCILFFCKQISLVEDVTEPGHGEIATKIVPQGSDFDSGKALWKIRAEKQQTQLSYDADLHPDFFIPPLIGKYFVESELKQSLMTTMNNIECHAKLRQLIDENQHDVVNAMRSRTKQCNT